MGEATSLEACRASLADLSPLAAPWEGPLALVDLSAEGDEATVDDIVLPPCPVIGFGNPAHPLAVRLDCVVEPPVTIDRLARQVLAHPQAAAVTVGLLRILPGMSPAAGLLAESLAYGVLQGSAEHATWQEGKRPAGPPPGMVTMHREAEGLDIVLHNPVPSAIDREARDQLFEALSLAVCDPSIRPIRLLARGRAFSLGADLAEFGTTRNLATAHLIRARTLPAHMAWQCADRLEARIEGACVGAGLELAAWAKRIEATSDAWFQLPELAMGVLPGAGGCVSLTRRIGRQRTALMILSGRRISARTALAWGLVDALVDELPADPGGAHAQ